MSMVEKNSAGALVGAVSRLSVPRWLFPLVLPVLMIAAVRGAPIPKSSDAGRLVYEVANCIGCHKWHGGGGGGYGGVALSLRKTALDRDQIIEVVRCGRPGTGMPYHGRDAYEEMPCYGMTKADAGEDLPRHASKLLTEAEIAAVAAYVDTAIKGKGEPSREDCVAFWGDEARQCRSMR